MFVSPLALWESYSITLYYVALFTPYNFCNDCNRELGKDCGESTYTETLGDMGKLSVSPNDS